MAKISQTKPAQTKTQTKPVQAIAPAQAKPVTPSITPEQAALRANALRDAQSLYSGASLAVHRSERNVNAAAYLAVAKTPKHVAASQSQRDTSLLAQLAGIGPNVDILPRLCAIKADVGIVSRLRSLGYLAATSAGHVVITADVPADKASGKPALPRGESAVRNAAGKLGTINGNVKL